MADFARIIQCSSIGYSSPSLCLGRSRIPPKFPFTTNSEIWFSRLNVMSRSLSLCAFTILRWNSDFLCLRASLIEYISSSSVGSAILDLVKLSPRLCTAKLKVGPISSNNFQAWLKIEELIDEAYELVDIGYVKDVYDEVELKLNDIMKMVSEIRYLLREKDNID